MKQRVEVDQYGNTWEYHWPATTAPMARLSPWVKTVPFLAGGLGLYLWWNGCEAGLAAIWAFVAAASLLLLMQAITAFSMGDMARELFLHAGLNPFVCGVIAFVGIAVMYLVDGVFEMRAWMEQASAMQQLGASWLLAGCPAICAMLWPFYTVVWYFRLVSAEDAENEMRGAQKDWDAGGRSAD